MKQITLADAIQAKGMNATARALGMTGPALIKAARSGRKITVTLHDDGRITAEERRPFPCQGKRAA